MTTARSRNPNMDMASVYGVGVPPTEEPLRSDWYCNWRPDQKGCPGLCDDGAVRGLPVPNLESCTREEVQAYFDNGWVITEVLFSSMRAEKCFSSTPYHGLRHPLIFYFGHPAVLYINKLRVAGVLSDPINPLYEQLFETGVDEMSWDEMAKNDIAWPSVSEVLAYRLKVYEVVTQLIRETPALAEGHAPITVDSPLWALFLGFEHERIHIETSSVLMRELPLSLLRRPAAWPPAFPHSSSGVSGAPVAGKDFPAREMVPVAGGTVTVGKPRDYPSFGWDNEYGSDDRSIRPFAAGRGLVSNGEFYAFVTSGAYAERRFWSEEGWRWRTGRNANWPCFWVSDGPTGLHRYRLRLIFQVIPMQWDWPVEINQLEASAYCAWLTETEKVPSPYRLLTEGEHTALRRKSVRPPSRADHALAAGGQDIASRFGYNLALAYGSPSPVSGVRKAADAARDRDAADNNNEGGDFHDVFGNVWQWTDDDFHPLTGFKVHPYYLDFSTPCFDGEHSMIVGGSFVSCGDEASRFARFHFRRHFTQMAGFRLSRSAVDGDAGDPVRLRAASTNSYESQRSLGEYMLLHFGSAAEQYPYGSVVQMQPTLNFPQRLARRLAAAAGRVGAQVRRALDVGCAVGGASFELARTYGDVVGVDLSASFVNSATTLAAEGQLAYIRRDEGDLVVHGVARVPEDVPRGRVTFRRADACSLPADFVGFDAVLLANLLCRLPSPQSLLSRLAGPRGIVAPGGLLLIASPFSWLEEYTPHEAWLGGYVADGKPVRSRDVLLRLLEKDFELLEENDEPLLIREHNRKYQLIFAHTGLWRRRQ